MALGALRLTNLTGWNWKPRIATPPTVKFKDLEEVVSSRIVRDQIKFDYRFDFMRVAGDTVLVPITLQIPNNQLSYQSKDEVHCHSQPLCPRDHPQRPYGADL